jgi:ribosome maturation factor RimP
VASNDILKSEASLYNDIPEDLRKIVEPVVQERGQELLDITIRRGSGEGLIRVIIDSLSGDGRVPVEDLESISREVGVQLDAVDYMSSRYSLEVTSPGLDRVLAREKDFEAAAGLEVKLQTRRPVEARKRFRGVLIGFQDGIVSLEVDGSEVRIPFEEVEKANSIYQFSRDDFAGAGSGTASK